MWCYYEAFVQIINVHALFSNALSCPILVPAKFWLPCGTGIYLKEEEGRRRRGEEGVAVGAGFGSSLPLTCSLPVPGIPPCPHSPVSNQLGSAGGIPLLGRNEKYYSK